MKISNFPYGIGSLWVIGIILLFEACQSEVSSYGNTILSLPEKVDFNFHIRPILSDRCYACHGPDEKARKANLRLDIEAEAFALLDSTENRYAIFPGNLKKSHLIDRIESSDPDYLMPPPESNLSLTAYEIKLLKKWIEQGADWKPHWAFIPPQKAPLPKAKKANWPINPIDHFILAKLEEKGLSHSDQAEKTKLIRRLYFDLTGLPPTIEAIDAFIADDTPEAYEKVVDHLFAQPAYGERLAMDWMDLARYADSHGYQDDIERSMWPWRDWVIKAFNDNMPYNDFVTWQLGGDLLPDATYEQKLATGFNRNHKITQEVGVIDEEYRVTYVLDRVNTFSTAFLGLTVECAQCHDHKYDPISQKEYYSLFSFFNNVPEKGRVDYGVEVAEPFLALPEEKANEVRDYINSLFENQDQLVKNYANEKWKKGFDAKQLGLKKSKFKNRISNGLKFWLPLDYFEEDYTDEIVKGAKVKGINNLVQVPGKYAGGIEFMGSNYAQIQSNNLFNFKQPFSFSFWMKSLDGGISGPVFTATGGKKDKLAFRIQVTSQKNIGFYLKGTPKRSELNILSKETVPENKWVHIGVTYDGKGKGDGVNLYMDGKPLTSYILDDRLLVNQIPSIQNCYLGTADPEGRGLVAGQIDEFMFFSKALNKKEIQILLNFNPLIELINREDKTETDRKRLFYQQLLHQDAQYQSIAERLREYRIRQGRMEDIVLKPTMVMADMDTIRPAYVLERGQYDAKRERVNMGTPKSVLAFSEDYPKNRLGLSQWLFDSQNPLTARVAVNRYWQMIFGKGIVATPGDFGSQGALPSHPTLLDWLASDFQENGWDLKRLLKMIVMSATYRQSTQTNEKLQKLDPENIYLARGPQMRLQAEMVRDHALAISGLLSSRIGGPSVKPYHPKGLWLEVASGNQSLRKYIQDHGHDLYRRSLYSFWKRTIPPPSMIVFDAPSREQCIVERSTTSTPMQALVLLNDPQFVEASRLIATRMLLEGGISVDERIEFAFKLATSRAPNAKEITSLSKLLATEIAHFKEEPQAANHLISIGEYPIPKDFSTTELAAYTVVANAILNLTETIRKG